MSPVFDATSVMASHESAIDGFEWEEWENCIDLLENEENEVSSINIDYAF